MFLRFRQLINATSQVSGKCESRLGSLFESPLGVVKYNFESFDRKEKFHTSLPRVKQKESVMKRKDVQLANKLKGVVDGVGQIGIDSDSSNIFPTLALYNTKFAGVNYLDVPIVHVKATKNNTILSLTDKDVVKCRGSCGIEGYKNTRKGTAIAAQSTGFSFATKAVKWGYSNVRVLVKGLGPGRLSALKGMHLGGLNIISITDRTIDYTNLRPKKQRRL